MNIAIFLITIFICELHPFNISVTEIKHNEAEKALQITVRFFLDDLEDEYSSFYKSSIDIMDTSRVAFVDSLNSYYMNSHFNIYVNDKDTEIFYLGKEYDDDTMVLYLEIYNVSDLKKLTVYNSALMASFEEQTNLIHIYKNKDFLKTIKLTREKTDDEYEFQ